MAAATCSWITAYKSNAGLYYQDRDEFIECAKLLLADERLRDARWAATARNTSSATTAGT